MTNLKQKTVSGLFWSFFNSFGNYLIKFGFTIVIARTLSPSDYGIIGMIVIFTSISSMLIESGFAMALIQKKDADETDFSTVFWFNLVISIIIYLILFFSANLIASFYEKPILVSITRIIIIAIPLGAFNVVQVVILTKRLDFKLQAFINLASAGTSGVTGLIFALYGFAVWALVFQTLAGGLVTTLGFLLFNKWKPKFIFSFKSLKNLYRYGFKIFLQGISSVIFEKIYYPLIGKFYSASQLGFYTYADRFYDIVVRQTTIAYGRVTFPVFSLIQDQKERFTNTYLKTHRLLSFIMFPITLTAIISSKSLVIILLTQKWLPVVPLMTVLFIEGFFFSLLMLNQNTFNATGRSDISFKVDLFKKILTVSSIFIVFPFGIRAMIIGQIVSSFICFILSSFILSKVQKINLYHQLRGLFPIFLITFFCGLINWFVIDHFIKADSILLITKVTLIPLLYIFLSFAFRLNSMHEFIMIFDNHFPERIKTLTNKWFIDPKDL